MSLTTISYGGGVQSTAMLVLACEGKLGYDVKTALFANVGDDSEHPSTLRFVREVAIPWAAERGVEVLELRKTLRGGGEETLMGRLTKEGSRSLPIPIRMPDTGAPGNRSCTQDFKIKVIQKWLKANGASDADPATVCIGISTDELHRAGNGRDTPFELRAYPLLELGLSRNDCHAIIRNAGLPKVGKSSCYFCPFHRPQTWAEMRRDEPELFAKSQELEDLLNERRDLLERDHVYLTRFGKRLSDAIPAAQDTLPGFEVTDWDDDGSCDSGHCFT